MVSEEFTGLTRPSKKQHQDQGDINTFLYKDAFKLPTLVLFGALIQSALFLVLPVRLALAPTILFLFYTLVSTSLQASGVLSNPFMDSVIVGRTSAQLPSRQTGRFGSKPAAHPVVVFHFGVRINPPLGMLAPGAKQTFDHFTACNDLVMEHADDYGMLGLSPWRAGERGSSNTLMVVYYFRDLEALNKFAHDDIHRKAWDWIVKAGHKHIGFFHEAFCVPAGAYESIYGNMPPLLMGAASVRCTDDDGEEQWVRPVVSADVSALRSQFGRMGKAVRDGAM